ncbi:MAG: PAS domain S-box protein [candidate division KSB1 bacterium]|nr:PAS domain S-box protein [candidate division KSB1 bacterium]
MEEPIKIVIVDDDAAIVDITRRVLEQAGYQTFPAYTGREAIEAAHTLRPQLLLLDVNLPDISGFEVCRQLKSDPQLEEMFIVILSSTYTDGDSAAKGLEIGADGYIFRPIGNRELVERIKAYLRIQQAEQRFKGIAKEWQTTFDSIREAVLLTDADMTVIRCNLMAEKMTGKSAKEIIGQKCWQVVHRSDRPIDDCPLAEVRQKLHRCSIVFEEQDRRFHLSVDPVLDSAGKFVGTVHVITDISEEFRVQQELAEKERQLRTLLGNLDGMVYACLNDEHWTMTFVSDGAKELTGYSADELLYNQLVSFNDLIHPDDRARVRELVEASLAAQQPYELEYRIIAKDGSLKQVWERGRGVWIDGRLDHLEGLITDITARVQAEEDVKRLAQEFQEIFNSTNEAIFVDDAATGRMIMVNHRTVELYGYDSAEEILAGNIGDLSANVPPFTEEKAQRRIRRAIEEGPQTFEWLAKKKNGEIFWVEVSLKKTEIGGKGRILAVVRDISERKAAEEAMRQSEEQFHTMFEQHGAVMLLIDPKDGRIVDANLAAEKFYGRSRDELKQMFIQQINTLPQEEVKAEMERARMAQKNFFQFKHRLADGSIRDVEVYSSKITIRGKEYLYSIIHDVTERCKAEQALALSEERFRKAFNVSPDAVNINRLTDGLFVSANNAFYEITGYSPEEVIGKTSIELNIWEDLEDRKRLVDGLQRDGVVRNLQARFRMKDGSIRIGMMSAALVELNGEPHILNITRDVTDLIEAQEALRRSEQHWAALAEISPVGIFRTDAAGSTTYVNPRWCEISGLAAAEALGQGWLRAVHPEDRDRLAKGWKKAVKSRLGSVADYRFLHADGSVRWVYGQTTPEKDENGRIIGYVGTITDITERKQIEQELLCLNRFYALLSQVNQAVVRAKTQKELFDEVCRTAVEYGKFRLVWIGLLDEKGEMQQRSEACCGENSQVKDFLSHSFMGQLCAKCPVFQAVKGQKVIINDLTAATPIPCQEKMLQQGILSVASVPIFKKGQVIGAINFYAEEKGFFTEQVQQLLEETGMDVSFAVDRMAAEEERSRAEKALRQSRQMLRLVIDSIPVRVFWKDRESKYLGCNKIFALDSGFLHPEELLGKTDYDMGWREQADLYRRDDREVIETGLPKLNYEEPQTTPDGGRIWLRTSKVPLTDADGNIIGVLGVYEDITEMKKAHEMILLRERELRLLLNGMLEGMAQHELIYNEQGEATDYRILDVNSAFEKITGITREKALGEPASQLYGTGKAPYLEEYAAVVRSGQPRVFESYFAPMGKHFMISVFSPQPNRFVTIFFDITERKEQEAALKEKLEELERWQQVTLGREDRIIELKQEVNELLRELGRPPRYQSFEGKK